MVVASCMICKSLGGKKFIFKMKDIIEIFSTQMPESIILKKKQKQKPKTQTVRNSLSFSYTLPYKN